MLEDTLGRCKVEVHRMKIEATNDIINACKVDLIDYALEITAERNALKVENVELKTRLEKAVELPVKVGDTVYLIREAIYKKPYNLSIEKTSIDKIIITNGALRVKLSCNSTYETSIRSFGKTMFFAYEAAEARLKELDNQK